MKVKIEVGNISLTETTMNVDNQKTKIGGKSKVASIVKKLKKENPEKKLTYQIRPLSEGAVNAIRTKMSNKKFITFMAITLASYSGMVAADGNGKHDTANKIAATGLAANGANLAHHIGQQASAMNNNFFLIKFNLKDSKGHDQILIKAENKTVVEKAMAKLLK